MAIPAQIYQTWKTNTLPPLMAENRRILIERTPGFKHYLFDDEDCRRMIEKNFDPQVLAAYDKLIPGAFKADLWRYCVLYLHGGVYLDIKMNFDPAVNPIKLLTRPHYPLDVPMNVGPGSTYRRRTNGIYQGMLICPKGCLVMRNAITQCTRNVLSEYYGPDCLSISGPTFLYNVATSLDARLPSRQIVTSKKDWANVEFGIVDHLLVIGGRRIAYPYRGYRGELLKSTKSPYAALWQKRQVYRHLGDSNNDKPLDDSDQSSTS